MDQERQLLGFPSPGKRRDEGAGEMKSAQSPSVVDVAQVQAAASSAGQAQAGQTVITGQTGSATAGEAEQAEPSQDPAKSL